MSVPPELRLLQLMPSWRGALQALRQDLPLTYYDSVKRAIASRQNGARLETDEVVPPC